MARRLTWPLRGDRRAGDRCGSCCRQQRQAERQEVRVRDRPLGRPALQRRAGERRRAEPDRRHERLGPRVHRPRRRPEGRQRHSRLVDADDCSDAAVQCRARRTSTRSTGRRCSRPATTTGPTATARRTAASTRSSGSTTSGRLFFSTPVLAREAADAAGRADRPALLGWPRRRLAVVRRAVRREPPLDVQGVTYATLNVQGSCNNLCDTAPDPGRVRRPQRRRHRLAARRRSRGRRRTAPPAVMIIAQADPGFDLHRRDARAAARSEDARRDRRPAGRLPDVPHRAARRR